MDGTPSIPAEIGIERRPMDGKDESTDSPAMQFLLRADASGPSSGQLTVGVNGIVTMAVDSVNKMESTRQWPESDQPFLFPGAG